MVRATANLSRAPHAVGIDVRPRPDARAERVFRSAVAHETLLARETARDLRFDPGDARWRLAIETSRRLQGVLLPFEDRRRILALANRLGVRPFDANLIVAVVQDRARRGEPLESAASTIDLIPRSKSMAAGDGGEALPWMVALVVAGAIDAILIAWLMLS